MNIKKDDEEKRELAHFAVIAIGITLAFAYCTLIIAYSVDFGFMKPFASVLMFLPPLEFLIVPIVTVFSVWKIIYIVVQILRGKPGIGLSWKFLACYAFFLELGACFILAVYSITNKWNSSL